MCIGTEWLWIRCKADVLLWQKYKIIPRAEESSVKESCYSTYMSGNLNFGFLHLYFKLSFFKTYRSISCAFLHFHWYTGTYDSEHLNVWCLRLIFVESRGEFWEAPVFVYPDLSSLPLVFLDCLTLSILPSWLTAHLACKILVIVRLKVALWDQFSFFKELCL